MNKEKKKFEFVNSNCFVIDFFVIDFFVIDIFVIDFFAIDFFVIDFFAIDFFMILSRLSVNTLAGILRVK